MYWNQFSKLISFHKDKIHWNKIQFWLHFAVLLTTEMRVPTIFDYVPVMIWSEAFFCYYVKEINLFHLQVYFLLLPTLHLWYNLHKQEQCFEVVAYFLSCFLKIFFLIPHKNFACANSPFLVTALYHLKFNIAHCQYYESFNATEYCYVETDKFHWLY